MWALIGRLTGNCSAGQLCPQSREIHKTNQSKRKEAAKKKNRDDRRENKSCQSGEKHNMLDRYTHTDVGVKTKINKF